jgi:hypothetical protein
MTVTRDQKIAAVGRLLDDLRWSRGTDCIEAQTYDALTAIAVDLRAETPAEIGKVRQAITHQVQFALRAKAHSGYFELGNMQALTEAICGKWFPVITKALEQFEKETV